MINRRDKKCAIEREKSFSYLLGRSIGRRVRTMRSMRRWLVIVHRCIILLWHLMRTHARTAWRHWLLHVLRCWRLILNFMILLCYRNIFLLMRWRLRFRFGTLNLCAKRYKRFNDGQSMSGKLINVKGSESIFIDMSAEFSTSLYILPIYIIIVLFNAVKLIPPANKKQQQE